MESAAEEIVDTQVQPAARRCLELFESALQATSSASDYDLLIIMRDRFRIWAGNAYVFREDRWSLDYHLRELPEEKLDQVISLINAVCSNLLPYISPIKKPEEILAVDRPLSDANLEASGAGPILLPVSIESALESIRTHIFWLHGLSKFATPAHASLHVQRYRPLGVDFDGLSASFASVVARDFPRLAAQLQGRMARAMVERYRRILYLRNRYPSGWKQQRDHQHEGQPASPEKAAENKLPSNDSQTPAPDTTKQQKVVENRSMEETEILLPPPPKSCQTESSFTCELCCVILPSDTGRNRVSWSEHVIEDLRPYVCLFDRCDRAHRPFLYSKVWLRHMKDKHLARRFCFVEDCNRRVAGFGSQEELAQHMYRSHHNIFDPETLLRIIKECREPAEVVFEACPFCHETPEHDIEEHVGHHLRYLALKSITWQDDRQVE